MELWVIAVLILSPPNTKDWEYYLDNDSYRIREQATQRLHKNGSRYVIYALLKSDKPEVKRRASVAYGCRKADMMRSLEPFPFIDSMWWSMKHHKYLYHSKWERLLRKYLDSQPWNCGPGFTRYSKATEAWATDMLDSGVPLWVIKLLFWELRRRDVDFLARFRLGTW